MDDKQKILNNILRAIEKAKENGYKVVISSDPEGNAWNELHPTFMLSDDNVNDEYIPLYVYETIDDDEIFKN